MINAFANRFPYFPIKILKITFSERKPINTESMDTDRASAGLIRDLKQRGLLDETLVIWGGEFGRTNYCQGVLKKEDYGRDHHPRCFTVWMAGGGVRPGVYGETDEFGYNIARDPVHDLQSALDSVKCDGEFYG